MFLKLGNGLSPLLGSPAASGTPSPYLDGVSGLDVCFELDATVEDSYGGSGQTWANLIASPADGAGQTDYDFYRGADGTSSTDDPTFNGSAGDAAAYFGLDGGDFFEQQSVAGDMLTKAHMTSGAGSGPRWLAFAFQLGQVDTNIAFMGTTGSAANGFRFLMNSDENLRFLQGNGTTTFNSVIIPPGTWAAATDYLFIVTFDSTNPGSEKYWINTTTGSNWFTAYSPNSTTTPSTTAMQFGASADSFIMPSGSRIYAAAGGTALLTDTEAAEIFSNWEARHSRDYTP